MAEEFDPEELEALYRILLEIKDDFSETEEEHYDDYYDEYVEPISRKTISLILKKVAKQLPANEKNYIDKKFLKKKYHTYNNDIDENVYRTLKKAMKQLRTVEIEYFNMNDGEFRKRKIDVYYTSRKYTIGYCHLRKDMRKFRTSRIASVKPTARRYEIPEDFDKNKY